MKKFLVILALGLLWCNFGNALEPEEAKKVCKDIGYEIGTEKFTDCAIKLVLEDRESQKGETSVSGAKKGYILRNFEYRDCSYLKGKRLHKYLACKAGSDRYADEPPLEVKEKKGETFNEKYNSFTDIFKKTK